jgi:hypothetical protein
MKRLGNEGVEEGSVAVDGEYSENTVQYLYHRQKCHLELQGIEGVAAFTSFLAKNLSKGAI